MIISGVLVDGLLQPAITVVALAIIAAFRISVKTLTELTLYRRLEMENMKKWLEDRLTQLEEPSQARDTAPTGISIKEFQQGPELKRLRKLTKAAMDELQRNYDKQLDRSDITLDSLAKMLSKEIEDSERVHVSNYSPRFFRPTHLASEGKNTVWAYSEDAKYPVGWFEWWRCATWRSILYKRAD